MPAIPRVTEILARIQELHSRKNEDYSASNKPFENFERSAEIGKWFKSDSDKPYAILIGTKLARLATLLNSQRRPNNESIEDSFLDLATYCVLWAASYK